MLMDAFIKEGDAAGLINHSLTHTHTHTHTHTGAVSVYNQMEEDEVVPDGMTFHLASRAHSMLVNTMLPWQPPFHPTLCYRGNHYLTPTPQGTLESLEEAELLCRQCRELEPKLGCKSFVVLVKSLLTQVAPPTLQLATPPSFLSQEKGEEAVSLLSRLERDQLLLPQV